MNLRSILGLCFGLAISVPNAGLAQCGGDTESCAVPMGTYEVLLPEVAKDAPIVVHLHGYGGNGKGALKQTHVALVFRDRGYAVIAPNGLRRGGDGPTSWNFLQRDAVRDEPAFYRQVVEDAVKRFDLDRDRVLLSGFSIGASMVHYTACADANLFAAYAPVAGSFWQPHPESCAGPIKLLHTHGWTDGTFPLEGRRVGSGFTQGDAFQSVHIWREANECTQPRARKFQKTGKFMRRAWTECTEGTALEFALFDGGHVVPNGWADMAADWFEDVVAK